MPKNKKDTRDEKTDEKKDKKTVKNSEQTKPKGSEKASKNDKDRRDNENQEKAPRSSKLIHQFIPFLLGALALLIAVCLIAVELFHADMGVLGNFLCKLMCGLFGVGAFFIPVGISALCVTWHSVVDNYRTRSKLILATASMLLFSMLIHVFSGLPNTFNIITLWNNGVVLKGGGVLGGFLCELLLVMFKHIGSTIIIITGLCVSLMILFNLTPKNIWIFIRYRMKLRKERKAERLAMEKERAEAEEKAEKERRLAEPEKEDSGETVEEKKPATVQVSFQSEKKATRSPAPDIMSSMPEPLKQQEDEEEFEKFEEPQLKEIFSGNKEAAPTRSGHIISIDLPASKDEKPSSRVAVKTEDKEPVRKNGEDVKVSMKVDTEALSELESLRGGDAAEDDEEQTKDYAYPPVELMKADTSQENMEAAQAEMNENAQILKETLASFNIGVKDNILCSRGPTITRYELRPEVGVRVRSIANLVDDISLSLASSGVRIEAPIPNKPYVGIEVPNHTRLTVFLRSLIEHEKFTGAQSKLTACLGADVGGNPVFFDIAKMPHLLIAGATGMGKSVCINCIIVSLLYKASPDEVKLILIDPKKVEFNIYKDIPHLYAPIVSDPKKAAGALASAVAEMERRFELIEEAGVRDINNYNAVVADDPSKEYMPKMVIIIDELADLMMTAPGEVESSICRLAQKARAAGIHIIIGTQRPSVDVITGLIKANVPSRIACTVASQVDSRTIIDIAGAEKLIGKGDMLFAPVGLSKPMRVQGAFVSESEVESIVEYIKANNNSAEYNKEFISVMESEAAKCGVKKGAGGGDSDGGNDGETDPKFREAVKLAIDAGKISTSLMQRNLGVGYGRAAKIIDQMEDLGYVSPPDGNKPRKVLITMQEYMEKVVNDDIDSGEASDPEEDAE